MVIPTMVISHNANFQKMKLSIPYYNVPQWCWEIYWRGGVWNYYGLALTLMYNYKWVSYHPSNISPNTIGGTLVVW